MPPPNAQNGPAPPRLPQGPSPDRVRGPVEIGGDPAWPAILAVALAGLLATGVVIWWIRRRRKTAAPSVPPAEAALEELRHAAALTEDDDARFALLASGAVRRFLEAGCGVPALGHTTEEVAARLGTSGTPGSAEASRLVAFLERCDAVKFGRDRLRAGERETLAEEGRALIELCGQPEEHTAVAASVPEGRREPPASEARPQ